MAFSMAGGGPSHPEINVTPLIDVLLVLIIIFMIVVTQQKRKGLDAQIPEPQQKSTRDAFVDRTIVIQVVEGPPDQPPRLKINQESVTWDNLENRLHDIFKMRAERIAFVRGQDDVDFQYVADAIDVAREAGVEKVGLLGEKQ
jgi:biopolymer transport protein TolR